ncbi:hypothetical protein AHAS_Ahas09G0190900 [Arachis hypogaea]
MWPKRRAKIRVNKQVAKMLVAMMQEDRNVGDSNMRRGADTLTAAINNNTDGGDGAQVPRGVPIDGAHCGSILAPHRAMKEIGAMMKKFARIMEIPFKFNVVHYSGDLSMFNFEELDIREDEPLTINYVNIELSIRKRATNSLLGIRT